MEFILTLTSFDEVTTSTVNKSLHWKEQIKISKNVSSEDKTQDLWWSASIDANCPKLTFGFQSESLRAL